MEYRLYSFVNMYLSPLQHGLQTAHCVSDMFSEYIIGKSIGTSTQQKILKKWAKNDKTIIILNGGPTKSLLNIIDLIDFNNELPYTYFYEDEDSLNGALTCVSIIIPEYIYNDKTQFQVKMLQPLELEDFNKTGNITIPQNTGTGWKTYKFTEFERKLIQILPNYKLA